MIIEILCTDFDAKNDDNLMYLYLEAKKIEISSGFFFVWTDLDDFDHVMQMDFEKDTNLAFFGTCENIVDGEPPLYRVIKTTIMTPIPQVFFWDEGCNCTKDGKIVGNRAEKI